VTLFKEKTMVAPTMFPKEKGIKLLWRTTSLRDKRIKLPQGAISLKEQDPKCLARKHRK
jgi:hypothetical protein